jgi:adenine phosphoribosyltransferase
MSRAPDGRRIIVVAPRIVSRSNMELDSYIRHIPGFPREGILFHDIMPLLQEAGALRYAVDKLADFGRGRQVDLVLGAEARGFILGAALAYAIGVGFAAARKPGKLPYEVMRCEYDLEYGTDVLEMHADAIKPGQRVTTTCWPQEAQLWQR